MDDRKAVFEFLKPLVDHIGKALPPFCEIVLHDLKDPESSIIAISNGHVTGRKVGDGLDKLGFRLLRKGAPKELLNYRGTTPEGKSLRSSSFFLRDSKGELFGALGINIDITPFLALNRISNDVIMIQDSSVQETFEKSVNEVLDNYIDDAFAQIGKEASFMEKGDKVKFVQYLEERGAFLIRYSAERIARLLGVSRYTLYQYLEEVRNSQ